MVVLHDTWKSAWYIWHGVGILWFCVNSKEQCFHLTCSHARMKQQEGQTLFIFVCRTSDNDHDSAEHNACRCSYQQGSFQAQSAAVIR